MKSQMLLRSLTKEAKFFLLFVLFLLAIVLPYNVHAQHTKNSLKIKFEEFNRIDDTIYHKSLQIDLASLIKPGLLKLDDHEFVYSFSSENNKTNKQQNLSAVSSHDLSIYGSYAIYENTFMIDVNLYDVVNKREVNINPITGELDEFYSKLKSLTENITDAIESKRLSLISGKKKIAIIYKTKNKKSLKKFDIKRFKQETIQTTKDIKSHSQISLTKWDRAAQYYLSDMSNQEIAEKLDIDALLIANVEQDKNITMIRPTFYIRKSNNTIELGEIKSDYFNNIPLHDGLAFRTNSFFSNILKKDGSWNTEMYMEQADSFDGFFSHGYNYAKLSLPSISNYYYFKAQRFNKNSSDLHYNMAINYVAMKRMEEAKQEYRKSINLDKSKTNAYYNLWLLYLKETDYKTALKFSEEAQKNLKEDDSLSILMKGRSLYLNHHYKKAITYLENGVKIAPNYATLYANLGLSQGALYMNQEALKNFKKALELDTENRGYKYHTAHTMILIGSKLLLEKQYKKALDALIASKKYDALDYAANYIKKCYLMLGELEKAEKTFDEYLKKGYYSEDKDYYKFAIEIRIAFLNEGPGYLSQEYGKAVLKYINKHLEHKPNDAFAFWILGNTYTYLEDKNKSQENLEKAYSLNKTSSDIFLDLSESLLLNKQYEKSNTICFDILRNNSNNSLTVSDKMILKLVQVGNTAAIKNEFNENEAMYIYKQIEKGSKIKNWSFTAFKIWLNENLKSDVKNELLKLVETMEKNKVI